MFVLNRTRRNENKTRKRTDKYFSTTTSHLLVRSEDFFPLRLPSYVSLAFISLSRLLLLLWVFSQLRKKERMRHELKYASEVYLYAIIESEQQS